MLTLLIALLIGGLIAGLIAGLFGVGGGTVSVPVLVALFSYLGYSEDHILKLAIGTSLAVLTPTTAISFMGHWRKGAVQLDLLKKLALPVLGGVFFGSWLASFLTPIYLKTIFALITIMFGLKFLGLTLKSKQPPQDKTPVPHPFSRRTASITGTLIGTLSVLMGIGGGLFGNMLFTLLGYDMRRSVATSSGLGILIGLTGVIGFIWAGLNTSIGQGALPPYTIGYVSLIGAAFMIPASALTVPLGVKLAHSLEPRHLERIFGLYLMAVGLYILF